MFTFLTWFFVLTSLTTGLDNGVGKTPQMGWNSWNGYHCGINQELIEQVIKSMVSTGLRDAGYKYVNLDDCWQLYRDPNGTIVPDPTTFPDGIVPLVEMAHSNGLLFGLYSDAGNETCQGRPGSLGYETIDANTYANWGVDYLKYDNCNNDHIRPQERYPIMRDALNATGHPIFYSICEWGRHHPWTWAPDVGNSWRTTSDIEDDWEKMIYNWDHNGPYFVAGPGAWNDPDMLEIGNGGMTFTEYKTHFSLWCIGKSPLIIGCDINNMSSETIEILMNTELISVNQDPLGIQAHKIREVFLKDDPSIIGEQVWFGPLINNQYVLALLNRKQDTTTISVTWQELDLNPNQTYMIRDLWLHQNISISTGAFQASVQKHETIVVQMIPYY
ncbi:Melibiase family protein [Reticulomyxa filosa]|uniref:Alpha-galactosidase n=1 Tax=Reticulomyxa filosa TaxID=46433 RepID=X6P569_RETFI|nr:Melibiase family protein [Reticulomyxa filosa]|eukprot:ETO33695.1 Melibiase family protein [Reticulomyxa filosa]